MEVDFKNVNFDEAIQYILGLEKHDDKVDAIIKLAQTIDESQESQVLDGNFIKTINTYAYYFKGDLRSLFITEMGKTFNYGYFRKEIINKYANMLSLNQMLEILKGSSDVLTANDLSEMSVEDIVKYLNRYIKYDENYIKRLFLDRMIRNIEGERKAKLIVAMIGDNWDDEEKLRLMYKYQNDFSGEQKLKFIADITKKLSSETKKAEITKEYKDALDEPVDDTERNNEPIGDTEKNNKPIGDTERNNEPIGDTEKNNEEVKETEPKNNAKEIKENFIVAVALSIDTNSAEGQEAKNMILDDCVEDISIQSALKISRSSDIPTDDELKQMKVVDLSKYIKSLGAKYAQLYYLNKYMLNFEGEDKIDLIIKVANMMQYDDDKIAIIKRYATPKLLESLRRRLITSISTQIYDKDKLEYLINKYLESFEDKKSFLIGMKAFDRLKKLNIDIDLEDIYKVNGKKPISTQEFISMSAEQIANELTVNLEADNSMKKGIVDLCLEKCPDDQKKSFLKNMFDSFETPKAREEFILIYYVGNEAAKLSKVINKVESTLPEDEQERFIKLDQLKGLAEEENTAKLSEGFLVFDEYISKKNIKLDNTVREAEEAIKSTSALSITENLLTYKELKKAPKKIIKKEFEPNDKTEVTIYDMSEANYLMLVYTAKDIDTERKENILGSWGKDISDKSDEEKDATDTQIDTIPNNELISGNIPANGIVFAFFENIEANRIAGMGKIKKDLSKEGEEKAEEDIESYFLRKNIEERIINGEDDIKIVVETKPLNKFGKDAKGERLAPSAIVCYDHEPTDEEIKCAAAFKIPMIFIDTDMQAEKQRDDLEKDITKIDNYSSYETTNKLVTRALSFSSSIKWKGKEKQKELIDDKALSKIMTYSETLALKDIEDAQNPSKDEVIDVNEKISTVKRINDRINSNKKVIKNSLQYNVEDYTKDIKAIEASYKKAKKRIDILNEIRQITREEPQNVILLLEVYKSVLSADDIMILREKAEIAKEEKEKKKGFLSKLILGERHKEE